MVFYPTPIFLLKILMISEITCLKARFLGFFMENKRFNEI